MNSISLCDLTAFAEIDKDSFFLLQDPINQMRFKQLILENYFLNFKTVYQRSA